MTVVQFVVKVVFYYFISLQIFIFVPIVLIVIYLLPVFLKFVWLFISIYYIFCYMGLIWK